jgi:nucleoside-diphosphate-sugar epimerase
MTNRKRILVAGATGNLGGKIVDALLKLDADVSAIVRASTSIEKINKLEAKGVTIHLVDPNNLKEVTEACVNKDCVVSALAGLRDVIIDIQKVLLDAAVIAKVPRFIPSDYSLDFTNLTVGKNRNLDLRREFHQYAAGKPIALTTIFNGPFMDLLTGDMPMILLKYKKILYWGDKDQVMDFTTTYNVAEYTAHAALDNLSPRFLYIAGDRVSAREICSITREVTGKKFKMIRAGGVKFLDGLISVMKKFMPANDELYPPWQGMQYMRDMVEGKAKVAFYDNDRYDRIQWVSVKEYLVSQKIS